MYCSICLALVLLRRRGAAPLTVPGGEWLATLAILACAGVMSTASVEAQGAKTPEEIAARLELADLRKGSQVYVEGSLRTRKYTDKNGVEKYATDIRADSMQMLGSRQGMGGPSEEGGSAGGGGGYAPRQAPARPAAAPAQRPASAAKPAASNFDDMDDDIPF